MTFAAGRGFAAEPVVACDVPHDLVVVDVVERARRRRQRQPVQALVADDPQGGRDVAAEGRLEADHLAVEDAAERGPEPQVDLHRRAALELRAVDQLQRRIVERYFAAAEQLAVQIHVDRDEARLVVDGQAISADEDMTVRDVSGRAGHDCAQTEKRNRGRSTNSVSELTCAPWASFTRN